MNESMRNLLLGSLIGMCLQAPTALADPTVGNEFWKGYMPKEATKDMLSEPLKLVGKGRAEGMFDIDSCVYRNSVVTVVRTYCNMGADAERGDAEELIVIPHDHRGTLHLYAEPSSGKVLNVKGSQWHVDVMDSGQLPLNQNISKMSAKEIISYAHEQNYGKEIVRQCHAGSRSVISYDSNGRELPSEPETRCFVGKNFKRFDTEWMGELDHFFEEGNLENWIKMLRAVGVKKALPPAKVGKVKVLSGSQLDPVVAEMALKGIEATSESSDTKRLLDAAKRTDGNEKRTKSLESTQEAAKESSSALAEGSRAE